MSSDQQAPRPGQATFAGWLIIGGSIILVISAWQRISGLTTMEVQDQLRDALTEAPLSGTGLTLTDLSQVVRIGSMVAAGAATAAVVLGFQALRRSTQARLALTCLAPLVLVGGFVSGGFFAPLVVAGVVMLWLTPTRDWFAGRPWLDKAVPPPADPTRPDPFASPPLPPEDAPRAPGVSQAPPAEQAFGAPGEHSVAPAPYGGGQAPARGPRPGALVWACGVVWAMSGLAVLLLLLTAAVVAATPDELLAEVQRQQPDFDFSGISESTLVAGTMVVAVLASIWSIVVITFAVFAFLGHNWARIATVVASITTGAVCVLGVVANPLLGIVVVAAGIVAGLLLRRDVAQWCAGRRAPRR